MGEILRAKFSYNLFIYTTHATVLCHASSSTLKTEPTNETEHNKRIWFDFKLVLTVKTRRLYREEKTGIADIIGNNSVVYNYAIG